MTVTGCLNPIGRGRLLTKREILKLGQKIAEKGIMTVFPELYFNKVGQK
jgi:tmRNA-binding protein